MTNSGNQESISTESYRRGSGKKGGSSSGSGFPIGSILAVLMIALLSSGAWFLVTLHQNLAVEQERADRLNQRLEIMERELSMTGSALEEGGEHTKEQLNFWESEIRKLWAIANERNKGWINDNEQAIKKITKQLSDLGKLNRDLQNAVWRYEQSFETQELIKDDLAVVQLKSQTLSRSQRDLADKINSAQDSLTQLSTDLELRLRDTEEAVGSIDQFRLTVTRRLNELQDQITSLKNSNAGSNAQPATSEIVLE